jgi:hypothetical protein
LLLVCKGSQQYGDDVAARITDVVLDGLRAR